VLIETDPERSLETALQAKWQCRIGPMGERFRVWRDEAVRCRTMRDAGESGASGCSSEGKIAKRRYKQGPL
jgi:hypothetical protein